MNKILKVLFIFIIVFFTFTENVYAENFIYKYESEVKYPFQYLIINDKINIISKQKSNYILFGEDEFNIDNINKKNIKDLQNIAIPINDLSLKDEKYIEILNKLNTKKKFKIKKYINIINVYGIENIEKLYANNFNIFYIENPKIIIKNLEFIKGLDVEKLEDYNKYTKDSYYTPPIYNNFEVYELVKDKDYITEEDKTKIIKKNRGERLFTLNIKYYGGKNKKVKKVIENNKISNENKTAEIFKRINKDPLHCKDYIKRTTRIIAETIFDILLTPLALVMVPSGICIYFFTHEMFENSDFFN